MYKYSFLFIALLVTLTTSCTGDGTIKKDKNSTEETIEPSYYYIDVNGKVGFIDSDGKIIIEPQFDGAFSHFSEGVCYAELGDRRGLIDINGTFVMEYPDSVVFVADFVNGLARLNCGYNKNGIIDRSGNIIVPPIHYSISINKDADSLYILIEGANDKGDWFIANAKGETIGEPCDSIVSGFFEGLCAFKKNGKWGYMNPKGDIVIQPEYDFARVFSDSGLARVRKGKEQFFIDKTGSKVMGFDSILTGFNHNRSAVLIDGKICLINKEGTVICQINADDIYSFDDNGHANIIIGNKVSKIDTLGNIILSTEYEEIGRFVDGLAVAYKNDKYGYIDITGKEVIPVNYEGRVSSLEYHGSPVRCMLFYDGGTIYRIYFDLTGKVLWQDIPYKSKYIPLNAERKDFVEYFDLHLSELDPIEGIYYVTLKQYYQDRHNLSSIGLNDTRSTFYAVARDDSQNGYIAHCIDGSNEAWVNKFVKIGETNNYAIMKIDEKVDFSSEGRVSVDNPSEFEFRLEQGHNDWYNFFITYEFVKDYPPMSEYEKIMKAEWTGSGFAIADGYIVTNYHVTSGANTILVRGINGDMNERFKGYVVASDKEHDISIIKIVDKDFETLGKIPYVVGKTMVDVGDNIFVLGYPMTDTMGEEVKLTDGIISAGSGYKGDASMYQISAAVQPGNSGGPVFNSEVNVVGIVCGKHSAAENANYAIKTSYLYSLINSANLGILPTGENKIKDKELSKKVEQLKNYVYLIECSSK